MSSFLKFGTGWHSSIPNEFIQSPQYPALSNGAFRVFIVIISYGSPTSPNPFPKWGTLCRNIACCRHSLGTWLAELEFRGWIKREQSIEEHGHFGHNYYTIYPDDKESAKKRKHFLTPPSVIPPHTVGPHAAGPHAVKQHSKSTNLLKRTKNKENNNNNAAGAASGGAVDELRSLGANAPKKQADMGKAFMDRWCQSFETWFGGPYIQSPGEASLAGRVIRQLKCRPKDLLAYAFRMWVNTTDYDFINPEENDKLFNQIRGSRDAGFFLRNIQKVANEQFKPLVEAIPVEEPEYQALKAKISLGRPEAC
jgi:hypothetical protein